MKYLSVLIIVSNLVIPIKAQNINILEDILVSDQYVYNFNSSDSVFSRYRYKHVLNVPNRKKVKFDISPTGFGYTLSSKKYDSIYVSLSFSNNLSIINYFKIDQGKKEKINTYPYSTDTVQLLKDALHANTLIVPYLRIVDNNSGKTQLRLNENNIYLLDNEGQYTFVVTDQNTLTIRMILNNFIKDIFYNQTAVANSPYIVDLNYLKFKITKDQLTYLIQELTEGETLAPYEKEESKINFDKSKFSFYLQNSLFVTEKGKPVLFSKHENYIQSNKRLDNIIEITENKITNISTEMRVTESGTLKSFNKDTITSQVQKISSTKYTLKFDKNASAFEIFSALGASVEPHTDTLIEFNSAVDTEIIKFKSIRIDNLLNDEMIINVSLKDSTILYKGSKISITPTRDAKVRSIVNNFCKIRKPHERTNAPFEVKIDWEGNAYSPAYTYHTKSSINSFIKSLFIALKYNAANK